MFDSHRVPHCRVSEKMFYLPDLDISSDNHFVNGILDIFIGILLDQEYWDQGICFTYQDKNRSI